MESVEAQERLAERIIQENMSVRETERQLQRYLNNKTQGKVTRSVVKEKSLSIIDLEDRIRRVLGTKIALNVNQQGEGELRVFFYSKDELHSLIERLGAWPAEGRLRLFSPGSETFDVSIERSTHALLLKGVLR